MQCSDDNSRLGVETGILHSNTHDGDSERSSQTFSTSSLETPQSFEVCSLRLQTSVRHSFHQRALPPTRNKVGIFYSLAPPNWRTDRTHQPRVGSVPPAICKWTARRLVRPLTHGGVPVQQSHPLCYPTASIPVWHWMYSSHGLQTLTKPLRSRDSQWVYGKDENGNWRSEVYNLQSTRRHEEIL